jgi:anti-sigma factor RsiW
MGKLFARHLGDDHLVRWLDSELSLRQARRVARHLDRCEKCRLRMDDLDRVQRLLPKPELRPGFARDFERRLSGMRYEPPVACSRWHHAAWVLLFSGACFAAAAGLPDDAAHVRASGKRKRGCPSDYLHEFSSLSVHFSSSLPPHLSARGILKRQRENANEPKMS